MFIKNVTTSKGAHLKIFGLCRYTLKSLSSLDLVLYSMVLGEVIETTGASVILSAVQRTSLASNLCSSSPHSDTSRALVLSTECLKLDSIVGS